jgi:metal-responsive CopG/Arc/MetJ family transcriptional regulator
MAHAHAISITVPENLLSAADRIAKEEGHTRSELFREALRALLWKRRWEAVQAFGAGIAEKKGLNDEQIDALIHELRGVR